MKSTSGPFHVNHTLEGDYLIPKFAREKSFYKKAKVYGTVGYFTLRSYNTAVASWDEPTQTLTVFGWYSATTARHIKEFAKQAGFDIGGKHEIENGKVYAKDPPVLNLVF